MTSSELRGLLRTLAAALCVAALAACGGRAAPANGAAESPKTSADITAFENQPTAGTWMPVHEDIIRSPMTADAESRIVEAVSNEPVPGRVVDAVVIDLATLDWRGAMQWIHQVNVTAKVDPKGAQTVRRSAHLAWLMLNLRASYATDYVDLSRSNLEDAAPFVGQSMNLDNVDFSDSDLLGGQWHNVNLTLASFAGAGVVSPLQCTNCGFGTMQYPGTLTLTNGTWVPR